MDQTVVTLPPYPRRVDAILDYEVQRDLALYDPRSDIVHMLNLTASIVWDLCDGTRSVQQIAQELAEIYGMDAPRLETDVRQIIAEFHDTGVIL